MVVGQGAVGKTSLLLTFTTGTFPGGEYIPSVSDKFSTQLTLEDKTFPLELLDTTGHEENDQLRGLSYPSTDVFVLCFSVVCPDSLENLQTQWAPLVKKHGPKARLLVVGTKEDLREKEEVIQKLKEKNFEPISVQRGEQVARELGAVKYLECSALTQRGVREVFEEVVKVGGKKGEGRGGCVVS